VDSFGLLGYDITLYTAMYEYKNRTLENRLLILQS